MVAVISIRAYNTTTFCINYKFNSLLLPLIFHFLRSFFFCFYYQNKSKKKKQKKDNCQHAKLMHECYLFVALSQQANGLYGRVVRVIQTLLEAPEVQSPNSRLFLKKRKEHQKKKKFTYISKTCKINAILGQISFS